jgi:hypothetical protein
MLASKFNNDSVDEEDEDGSGFSDSDADWTNQLNLIIIL